MTQARIEIGVIVSKICVTGAGGMTGVVTVMHLLSHGHDVVGADVVPLPSTLPARWSRRDFSYVNCDLTDYGDTVATLAGVDAVVHLANVPAPGIAPAPRTLHVNNAMNANVFLAAAQLGIGRVVWASSETTLGLDFDRDRRPAYVPLDESHYPRPTTTYSLSKVLAEVMAEQIASWSPVTFVALRLSNIIRPEVYASFPDAWRTPELRQFNLWSYIDVRDVAEACRLALTADVPKCSNYIIAAQDSVMPVASSDLMKRFYPDVPLTRQLVGFESLQSTEQARAVLGFQARFSWRDHIEAPPPDHDQ
jgi:nucleoside-diphosphate-sugar epimerase